MDYEIELHPWEPDDKGGGFACLTVNAEIYTEDDLDKLINKLLKKRRALRRQLKRAAMDNI